MVRIVHGASSRLNCDTLGWTNAGTYSDPKVCGQSIVTQRCSGVLGYTAAAAFCGNAGARLCTVSELKMDEARDTGCALDATLVWTATPCLTGFRTAYGASDVSDLTECLGIAKLVSEITCK